MPNTHTATESEIRSAAEEARTVYVAVSELSQDGGQASVQDVHDRTGIPSSSVVGTLIRLQRLGWIRLSDDDDRTNRWYVPAPRTLSTMDAMNYENAVRDDAR